MSPTRRYEASKDLPPYWREYITEIVSESEMEEWLRKKRKDLGGLSILESVSSPERWKYARDFIYSRGSKLGVPYALGEKPPTLAREGDQRRKVKN